MNGIEIELSKNIDAFTVQNFLSRRPGVRKCHIVTSQVVRVYFNEKKVQAKMLIKALGSIGKKTSRVKHVVAVREVKPDTIANTISN